MGYSSLKEMAKPKLGKEEDPKGKGDRNIYVLNTTQVYIDEDKMVKRLSCGTKDPRKNSKTILLMGQTGSGKSTMINSIVNYILRVKWEDENRYEIIPEEQKSQTLSQTSEITVYEICGQESEAVPFSLTIIDTPGFGDTGGIDKDKLIPYKLQTLFQSKEGVHCIDAVCVVVNASTNRLTPTQHYIFDSVLSIFGKDIEDNILILMTFGLTGKPQALKAVKEAGVPHFKLKLMFNNVPFEHPESAELWKINNKNMERFISTLSKMKTKSLQLTQEVIKERRQLEACVEDLEYQMSVALNKQNELEETYKVLEENKEKMEANKDFEYAVTVYVTVKISAQKKATNCRKCERTCHRRCPLAPNKMLFLCDVMKNWNCTICGCSHSDHCKETMVYVQQSKEEKRMFNDLKQTYENALGETLTAEEVKKRLQDEINEAKKKVDDLLEDSYKCVTRLEEIALKPSPISVEDYLDLLILAERNNTSSVRMPILKKLKKKASLMASVFKRNVKK